MRRRRKGGTVIRSAATFLRGNLRFAAAFLRGSSDPWVRLAGELLGAATAILEETEDAAREAAAMDAQEAIARALEKQKFG